MYPACKRRGGGNLAASVPHEREHHHPHTAASLNRAVKTMLGTYPDAKGIPNPPLPQRVKRTNSTKVEANDGQIEGLIHLLSITQCIAMIYKYYRYVSKLVCMYCTLNWPDVLLYFRLMLVCMNNLELTYLLTYYIIRTDIFNDGA